MADVAPLGMLDEHAPRNTEHGGPAQYEPTPEERKAIKLVERLFDKAKRHRSQYDQKWLDYYHMFRGKQWKELRPSYRHTEVVNLIFRTIQSTVPIQMDTRPRFEFLPEDPSDQELADIVNQVAESVWVREKWSEQLLEVVYDSNFYGTGLSSMLCKEQNGLKQAVYSSADPFYCFPDPDSKDVNRESAYFVYAEPEDIRKVRKRYPKMKDFIKPDITDLMKGSKSDSQPMKFRSPVDQKVVMEGSNSMDLLDKDKVLVITAYLTPEMTEDDYEEVEKHTVDPESGEQKVVYEQQNPYPMGRKIVIANGVLLEDGPNPYDDGEIPYQRLINYSLPREFWGMSEIEQLEGPQKVFNKLVSFALDVLTLMGNPIWLTHASNGIDPENLVNRPGLVVEWDGEPGTKPERQEGVSLQPYVLQMIDRMGEWFDSVGGSQDVSRGVQPTGVTAASAISSLQEAAQTRLRQKARNLDAYLQSLGQQWVSRLFQYRTAPEIYRITNKDGVNKYFKMHVEEDVHPDTGETKKSVVYQPYIGGQVDLQGMKRLPVSGNLDLRVSTGSSLPFAKSEKEAKLLAYYDRGIIDEEEVLKGSDYPNYQAVLQRVMQKKQAEAEAAAQPPTAPAA